MPEPKLDRFRFRGQIVLDSFAVQAQTNNLQGWGVDSMNNELDAYYWNPVTLERVRATYQVHLLDQKSFDGYVDVDAESKGEAVELAKTKYWDSIVWEFYGSGDCTDVMDVECEHPPADAIMICRGCTSKANLDGLFEPDDPASEGGLPSASKLVRLTKTSEGGDVCD